jgi:flagellar hook-associated protein 2
MVDIVNALNAGSGIDIKNLAKSLTDAAREPQQKLLETKTKALEAKISSVGKIMSAVTTFDDALKSLGDPQTFQRTPTSSDSSKVTLDFVDGTIAPTFSGQVAVNQLATDASFLFPPLTSLDTLLAGTDTDRTLKLISGTTASPGTEIATIDLTEVQTLPALRDKINEITGYQATIIQGGTASSPKYYLGVKGGMGADASFHVSITTTSGGSTVAATGTGLILDGTEVIKQGTDSSISVDGVTITGSSNVFTDIVPGIKITALGTTSSDVTLSSSYNSDALSAAMATLVSGFNLMIDTIKSETQFSTDASKKGGLSNDPSTRALLGELRRFTTQPLEGFTTDSHNLAELGVRTNRDGTLTLDEKTFAKMLKEKPEVVEAVLASKKQVTDSRLSILSSTDVTPAVYTVEKIATSQWTINGQTATLALGTLTAGVGTDAEGLVLSLPSSVETASPTGYTTQVNFAKGLVERLSEMFGSLKNSQSSIQVASANAAKSLSEVKTQQSNLDARMAKLEERYVLQFAQMNAAVNEANNTKASMKTFIDAWTAGLKG